MGADIHWVIERKHDDGAWEAVASKDYLWMVLHAKLPKGERTFHRPAFAFGDRNYLFFGVLSGVRYRPEGQGRFLADPYLPQDISDHAMMTLDPEARAFHTPGHYSLSRLRSVAECDQDGCAPGEHDKQAVVEHLGFLEEILSGHTEIDIDQILVGPLARRDSTGPFPEMLQMSNHRRVEMKARADGLLPIADDTVRVLFAYDS
jgi:hypothetical protein